MQALLVIQLLSGISTVLPMILEDAVKFKALLAPLGPDVKVNIVTLENEAITEDDATMAEVNAWMASKGLPPLTPSSPTDSPAS